MTRNSNPALLLAGISALAVAGPAFAQTPPAAAPAQAAAQDPEQTIIVTGTRTTNRTVANSPVPVDVIGADQINNSGQTETNRVLNTLVPSFNFPSPSIADGSDALRPATLRGLGPDQTLVGQRQAPPRLGAAQHQRHRRPRQRGGRPQPDPGYRNQPDRGAA